MGTIKCIGETTVQESILRAALTSDLFVETPSSIIVNRAKLVPPSFPYSRNLQRAPRAATGVYDASGRYVRASGSFRGHRLQDAPFGGRTLADIEASIESFPEHYSHAVYGGFLRGHYGHILLEGFARMWRILDVPETLPVLVHASTPGTEDNAALKSLIQSFSSLNFDFDRLIFCHEPVAVGCLEVPEPAIYIRHGINPVFLDSFARLGADLPAGSQTDQPLYLSRAGLNDDPRPMIGEATLEVALERVGVRILRPETVSFLDGVKALRRHRRIIGPVGSAFHGTMFAPRRHLFYLSNGIAPEKLRTYAGIDRLNAAETHFIRAVDHTEDGRSSIWKRKVCKDRDHPVIVDVDSILQMLRQAGGIDQRAALTQNERAQVKVAQIEAARKICESACSRSSALTSLRLMFEARKIMRLCGAGKQN